jgi:hypothetical protein
MIADTKDLLRPADVSRICNVVAVNGQYEKLKILIDRYEEGKELF